MEIQTGGDAMTFSAVVNRFAPFILSILVGIGSAAITGMITTVRLDERVSTLERKVEDTVRTTEALRLRDDDYERRISRSEVLLETLNGRVSEVGGDVKLLLQRVGN